MSSDLEPQPLRAMGPTLDGDRLWLVGSHSRRRRKHDDDEGEPLSLFEKDKQSRNAHVLGCLRLDGEGLPVAGQRLAFDAAAGRDALSQFLAADPLIAPLSEHPQQGERPRHRGHRRPR